MPEQRPRSYLMCRPSYFDVTYSINTWMDPRKPVDGGLAVAQWENLRRVYTSLGHRVFDIGPQPGLPDMVFSANGALVVDGRALVARFRHAERTAEAHWYGEWFRARGWPAVTHAECINEGEGDFLPAGNLIFAASGFRTDRAAHREAQEFFGRTVIGLTLVDPRFYHLDTAMAVLDDQTIAYYPPAFSAASRDILRCIFPNAIKADERDAAEFGLNAVSDGQHVVVSDTAMRLASQIRERGYQPIGVDMSELRKAGGAAKCCTLELRP